MLNIELGQTYKTRAGNKVTIRAIDDDGRHFGDIVDALSGAHDRIASFSESGQYVNGRKTEFDIVCVF